MERSDYLDMAKGLIDTMKDLTVVLNTEVEDLYSGSNKALEGHYRRKSRLLAHYAASLSSLREANKDTPTELPAELNASLKEQTTKLATAIERNTRALAVAKTSAERVIDVIIGTVQQQRRTGSAYGVDNKGRMIVPPAAEMTAQAVTLDTTL